MAPATIAVASGHRGVQALRGAQSDFIQKDDPEGQGDLEMSRKAKSSYRHPLTGEARKLNRPFWIDRLPAAVHRAINESRAKGMTWQQTADAASTIAGRRIPRSTLHRWYDVRVEQEKPSNKFGELLRTNRELLRLLRSVVSSDALKRGAKRRLIRLILSFGVFKRAARRP